MRERSVFLCLVLAAMLTAFGCGDSSDGDGGSGGNGDGGGGGSSSACESLCGSSCIFEEVNPGDDFDSCVEACEAVYSDCYSELGEFVDCFESVDCDENAAANACRNETLDWVDCITGGIF